MELTGCLLHVVIIPSLFRNTDKREHVFVGTAIPLGEPRRRGRLVPLTLALEEG
jgi:hypothetical protein